MKPNGDSACSLCHGTGFVDMEPSERFPNGCKALCRCNQRARRRRQLDALRERSGLDKDALAGCSFSEFHPAAAVASTAQRQALQQVKEACEAFARAPAGWIVLYGPCGVGKTHLAYAIAAECLAAGRAVYYASVPELLRTLREGYDRPRRGAVERGRSAPGSFGERIEAVRQAEVLVLDDLGIESQTAWSRETVFDIVNYRYQRRSPLVVTTNANLRVPRGTVDDRVASRLLDGANLSGGFSRLLLLSAGDYRQRGAPR